MEQETPPGKPAWLQDLETKSWNLEMTISGAATVAVSFLPGVIDHALDYYIENLAPSNLKASLLFPLFSYSFFMTVAWVLIGFFALHLCMRALWVGAVGLHTAFPEGIRFQNLPNVSDRYKHLAEQRYGSLAQFILQLDKRANSLFALAFMIAMGIASIGISYILIFLVFLWLRHRLDTDTMLTYGSILYYIFMTALFSTLLLNRWLKRHPEKIRLATWAAKAQMNIGYVLLPFFFRPMQYLSLTFMSNLSRRKYGVGLISIIIFMMASSMVTTFRKASSLTGRTLSFDRAFFSDGSKNLVFRQGAYDGLRPEGTALPAVSTASDIVSTAYMPVFVKYPRYFDERLARICTDPGDEVLDKMPKELRRAYTDSVRLECFQRFLHVSINDTLQPPTEWLFSEKNGSKGLISYIDTKKLPAGKHFLRVELPSEQRPDSLETYGGLWFWLER